MCKGSLARCVLLLVVAAALRFTDACDDAVCSNASVNETLAALPVSARGLGFTTWMVLHTFAAYLPPGSLTSNQLTVFRSMVLMPARVYPSYVGRALYESIIGDDIVSSELGSVATGEDAQLWLWKVHNAVSVSLPSALSSIFPTTIASTIPLSAFAVTSDSDGQIRIANLTPDQRDAILTALKARWRGGVGATPAGGGDGNGGSTPPDRAMLGRAMWTTIHSYTCYLPTPPLPEQITSVMQFVPIISTLYPCDLCRDHFNTFINDTTVEKEISNVESAQDAILFWWKVHNIVTADQFGDTRQVFPYNMGFQNSQFLVPAASASQLQLSHMTKSSQQSVIDAMLFRWELPQGVDNPFNPAENDYANACTPKPVAQVKLQVIVMSKCPYCATLMQEIEKFVGCSLLCEQSGKQVTGQLQFELLYLGGLYNNTLVSLHGESEIQGDLLELCAKQKYIKDYAYVNWISCMDRNPEDIPSNGEACATEAAVDWGEISSCAQQQDTYELLQSNFIYTASIGVPATPAIIISGPNLRQPVSSVGVPSGVKLQNAICNALSPLTPLGTITAGEPESTELRTIIILITTIGVLMVGVAIATYLYVNPRRKRALEEMDLLRKGPSSLSRVHEEELF